MNFNLKNNYQTIFLVILSVIIIFQFSQLLQRNENEEYNSSEAESYSELESIKESSKKILKLDKSKKMLKLDKSKMLNKSSNVNDKYGSPSDIFDDKGSRIIYWKFSKPNPWSCLYFNQTKNTYTFGLNHMIDKKLLEEWNKIIPNIGVNDKEKMLMITSNDEESALAVINLVLSTSHNELSIKEIMESNLIDVSVSKIKAHPLVKSKILEQIISKLSTNKEQIKPDSSLDLATQKIDIGAYGGNEFSFI
tara:strand:+ start:1148 stop:1897 length:750 start_codon:yes stop_codon:yes gene_type:complete